MGELRILVCSRCGVQLQNGFEPGHPRPYCWPDDAEPLLFEIEEIEVVQRNPQLEVTVVAVGRYLAGSDREGDQEVARQLEAVLTRPAQPASTEQGEGAE